MCSLLQAPTQTRNAETGERLCISRLRKARQTPWRPCLLPVPTRTPRIAGGQAVLTFRALIKSARFDRAWKAIIGATDTPANDNINPCAVIAIAA